MFCPKCGTENPEGASFCPKCGTELRVQAKPTEGGAKPEAESSTGMSANTAGLLCYLFTWITGIIFVVIEKKSTFVRFHAWQSIMTFGAFSVAFLILGISIYLVVISGPDFLGQMLAILIVALIGGLIGVLSFILWIILMVQAKRGKMWKVPWAGGRAEKQASKWRSQGLDAPSRVEMGDPEARVESRR